MPAAFKPAGEGARGCIEPPDSTRIRGRAHFVAVPSPPGEHDGTYARAEGWGPSPAARVRSGLNSAALDLRNGNLAVIDLHQINVRRALAAFLSLRAVLFEFDRAIEAENIHLPQRGANGLRLSLAGDLDGFSDGADAVIAAEARGKAAER